MLDRILIMFLLLYGFCTTLIILDDNTRYQELNYEYETEKIIQAKEKAELEKEIRLLKTDLDIALNGFEEK